MKGFYPRDLIVLCVMEGASRICAVLDRLNFRRAHFPEQPLVIEPKSWTSQIASGEA